MAGSPLMLPGWAADLLNELGYVWPKSDEVKMFTLGGDWVDFGGELRTIHGEPAPKVNGVATDTTTLDVEAFLGELKKMDRGSEVVKDGGEGAMVVGSGLYIAAGLVLVLKITVIVQIGILIAQIASAIAAAGPTFGASLAWIPVAKKLANMAINLILGQVINALL